MMFNSFEESQMSISSNILTIIEILSHGYDYQFFNIFLSINKSEVSNDKSMLIKKQKNFIG